MDVLSISAALVGSYTGCIYYSHVSKNTIGEKQYTIQMAFFGMAGAIITGAAMKYLAS